MIIIWYVMDTTDSPELCVVGAGPVVPSSPWGWAREGSSGPDIAASPWLTLQRTAVSAQLSESGHVGG